MKSAINQMVEWLEDWQIQFKKGPCSDVSHCLRKAKILALEEDKEKPTREELLTMLSAWENIFGTSQLSHAHARLQAAEDKAKRLEFQITHLEKPTAPAIDSIENKK